MKVKLQILAKDFYESSYYKSNDCVITRALKRSGINARETGGDIALSHKLYGIRTPLDLEVKVHSMYKYIEKLSNTAIEPQLPQDFTYSLEIPDEWIK